MSVRSTPRHRACTAWCLLVLTCLGASTVHGAGLLTRLTEVEAGQFPDISMLLTVFTEKGHAVPGLSKDSFTVSEDGKPVSLTDVVVDETPVRVAMVLDTSGSMMPAMAELKLAAGELIRLLGDRDSIQVLTFGDRVREIESSDRRYLLTRIQELEPEGATALYDGLDMALQKLGDHSGRRFVVCFTDGRDQNAAGTAPQSAVSVKHVAGLAVKNKIPIFAIGLGTQVDRTLLAKLAHASGGRFYNPQQAAQLRKAFARALVDLKLQYRLQFRTPKATKDGTKRALVVTSKAQGQDGQGTADYLAPSPPPPPPPKPSVAATPASTTTIISGAVANAYLSMQGFPKETYYGTAWIYSPEPDGSFNEDGNHYQYVWLNADTGATNKPKVLTAGRYRLLVGAPDKTPILLRMDIELKAGGNVLVTPQGLHARPPESSTTGDAQPTPSDSPSESSHEPAPDDN